MKESLAHLSKEIREEVLAISNKIVEIVQPEMVILFGSYARGEMIKDEYFENGIRYEYKSDFDILIVVDSQYKINPSIGKRIRKKVKQQAITDAGLGLIFHDIQFLNSALLEGNYFFTDIYKEGIILYTINNQELAEPKVLYGLERKKKANEYFENWFSSANEFMIDCKNAMERNSLTQAAFLLHQATERLYTTVLLVYTDYKPKMHDLDQLDKQVSSLNAKFKTIFPRKTENEERLFTLLKKAYIDARYKLDFQVNLTDLDYLYNRVLKLKELVKSASIEKINSFSEQ